MSDTTITAQSVYKSIDQLIFEQYPGIQLEAANHLYQQLTRLADSAPFHQADQELDTLTSSGKAISTYSAAVCIKDYMRTRVFFKGIMEVVEQVQQLHPNTCIHILYAGTGPFATLALPLLARYTPSEVRFTLVDIHESSIESLNRVWSAMDGLDYIEEMICADAATLQLEQTEKYHIVLCETMQQALSKEPQFNIMLNLAPQLSQDVIWIPECIRVEAVLHNIANEIKNMRAEITELLPVTQKLSTIMDLTVSSVTSYKSKDATIPIKDIIIPIGKIPDFPFLALYTEVQVYGKHLLKHKDASITLPQVLCDLRSEKSPFESVCFSYNKEGKVGFEWELV